MQIIFSEVGIDENDNVGNDLKPFPTTQASALLNFRSLQDLGSYGSYIEFWFNIEEVLLLVRIKLFEI